MSLTFPTAGRRRIHLAVAAISMSLAAAAHAQSTASVTGTVKDPSGAVLPNATITLHNLGTDANRVTKADTAGSYSLPSVQPGDYSLTVHADGFSDYIVNKLNLQVDQHIDLPIPMSVSAAGSTIEVTAGAPVIDTGSITVGQVIDRQTVQEIPLNGRHFLDLTVLTPGGVTAPATGSLTAPSRGLGANSFVTAGNREDSVNFQINGVNLNDLVQNQITFQPSINTTSEFKINNSTYSAEYGRSSGSIVNVSTRSGVNKFHGEAFDYNRNNSFDARNFFNPVGTAQNSLKRNNFGGAVGGPLWHDKTFFFASYEGLRQHQGLPLVSTVLLPTDRAAVTDPVSKALLNYIPVGVANNATSNIVNANVNGPVQTDQGTIDILHNFNQSDILHGFYAIQKDVRTEPNLQSNTIAGFGDHRNAQRQILTINETHIFSPKLVNEARLGFNRISIAFVPNSLVDPTTLGFNNYPAGFKATGGLPQITISGYGINIGGPSGFPQGRYDTLGVVSDTATYTTGRHVIKFGGEFRRFGNANFSEDTGTLSYVATPAIAGVQPARTALANFQAGQAGSFAITPTYTSRLYVNALGGFIVDNFHLTPNFMIEAGFRFEWNGSPYFGGNKATIFDATNATLNPIGSNGYGSAYAQNYNYEPRVGFTFDVFGNNKSVIRGGYAIMADQPETNVASGLASNPPYTNKVSYTATSGACPTASPCLPTISNETLFASAAASSISVAAIDPHFRNAYTETFNLNLQQELPGAIGLSAGYYGSVGKHLRQGLNINEILPTTGARPYSKIAANSPIDPGASIATTNITQAKGVGISNYNALWLTARKNAGHGVQFTFNYQLSKSMDEGSLAGGAFTDILQPRLNYGLSDFDTRHRISANGIYDLPFHGNRFVEGFRLSGILQYQTGNPLNITTTSTYTGTANVQHPNLVGAIPYTRQFSGSATANSVTYFAGLGNTVCAPAAGAAPAAGCVFALPATGFGNMQRNGAIGPGFVDLDMSLEKTTKITQRVSLLLRADSFDIFNHANFANPGTSAVANSPTFGLITGTRFPVADAGSSRQLQLSGKILF